MWELRPGDVRRHSAAQDNGAPVGEVSQHLAVLNRLLAISADDSGLPAQLDRGLDAILSTPWLRIQPRGSIHLVDKSDNVLRIAAHRGFDAEMLRRCAIVPFGHGAFRRGTNSGGESMFFDFGPVTAVEAGDGIPVGLALRRSGRNLGVLTLYVDSDRVRDPDDDSFLASVTEVLATIIEHHQIEERRLALLCENRELTKRLIRLQEEEYRWLARELHDEMGQSLTAIKADAALIIKRCQTASPIGRSAKAIATTADGLYELTRTLIRHLRPGALDDLGLLAALESYLHEWRTRRPGIACTFSVAGDLEGLGEEINITLYRVMQECLTNVIRHTVASRVEVCLYRTRGGTADVDEICLSVRDNGRGVPAQEAPWTNKRLGLIGMRERVEGLGGRIALHSLPGEGFTVTVHLPLMADTGADRER